MNQKRILLAFLLLASVFQARAEWIDVTDIYFDNPRFDNNSGSGWDWNSNASSQTANFGCFEFWNGYFYFYKTLKLPKGNYRLSLQGYYRCGDFGVCYNDYVAGREEVTACIFAGEEAMQPIKSVFSKSFGRRHDGGWWTPDNEHYYPDNMQAAASAFAEGEYQNVFEFSSDGEYMDVGIRCLDYQGSNWCIFDNFKLEYDGEIVLASELNVTIGSPEILPGETTWVAAAILPENAASEEVTWESSNPVVASVGRNGDMYGNSVGTAVITATTTDGSNLKASATVTVVPDTLKWVDLTDFFLVNPRFDNNGTEGWEFNSNASSQKTGYGCFEFWNGYYAFIQTLKGMPEGMYKVSVQAFYRTGDNDVAYDAYLNGKEEITGMMQGGYDSRPIASIYSFSFDDYSTNCWSPNWMGGPYYPNGMESAAEAFSRGAYNNSLIFYHRGEEDDLHVGLYGYDTNYSNWCCFDNFKLEYAGNFVKATSIDVSIEKADIIISESTQCTATVKPDNALIKNVVWTSSNEDVATVDQNGRVTGIADGVATITATTCDGSNLSASVTVRVGSGSTNDAIVINEVMASNVDEFISPAFNFDGWMELYNPTRQATKLVGLYLSDNAGNLKKWRLPSSVGIVPARGFRVIWFDSNSLNPAQAPFKLDTDGGEIILSDGEKVIASVQYPESMERVSYARTTDGGETWGFTADATPGKTNKNSHFADAQLSAPVVDQPSQLFNNPLSVNVTIPAGTTLRYTTDGSLPTMSNGSTSQTGQFSVNETQCYRFRLFADDMLPSRVTTRSYIQRNRDFTLPVVSVVTDRRFLYDDSIGVYVRGVNGRPGNGQSSKCNWNMDWERPVNFSYLDADGEMVLNQDVNLEMCGGWSRAWTPHAFKLKGSKELGGNKNLPYPFFKEKPYIRNRTLQIRNGGNDTGCRIKDPALQYIVQSSGIDIDVQSYEPVHEFINGQYIGVLNVREPNNKHYVYANYGWDEEEIDQFEMSPDSGYIQKCGTDEAFLELVDNLSFNAADNDVYAEICKMLDIDEYVNYMAAEFYLANWDWPQNNVKGFRNRDNGKFRFIYFDLDGSFQAGDPFGTFMAKDWYTFDPLYPTSLGHIEGPIRFVTLFRNLLDNASFRKKFIDTFCLMGGSVYEANRAVDIVDQLVARVNPAMRLEGGSADNTANSIKNFIRRRNGEAINSLRNYWMFDLYDTTPQRVTLQSDVEGADILVNGIKVPTGYFDGHLFKPATLQAVAPAGHVFQGWASGHGEESTLLPNKSVWSYYDAGSLDNANWTSPSYNESGWHSGVAPFGYGKNDIGTTISYGNDQSHKRPTAYFRTKVNFPNAPKANDKVKLHYIIDDGFIVYVNGAEAGRYNMPSGYVSYNSYASSYAQNNPDAGTLELAPGLFHSGVNTIAVEVHNNSASSTDLYWEASISTTAATTATTNYYSTEATIALPDGDVSLTACYREMTPAEMAEAGCHPVCVNEVSASNNALINEYGKKNDWVELYNATNEDVDIEGMYLSDNLDQPLKYKVTKGGTSANTIIPAHGYLVVWCDKLETTSQALHAPFKLAGEEGVVVLTAANGSWSDILQYGPHDGNSTVGRYPDGTADIYMMNVPTIQKTNILTSYMVKVEQGDFSGVRNPYIAAANGFRIYYTTQQLCIKSEEGKWAKVDIYTSDGRLVEQQTVTINHGAARLDVSHLPNGFYVARATDDQGSKVACKFAR